MSRRYRTQYRAGDDQVGDFDKHFGCRCFGTTLGRGASFTCLLARGDSVDLFRHYTKTHGELNVVGVE